MEAHCFKQAQSAESSRISCSERRCEALADMGLCRIVVDLLRVGELQGTLEAGLIREISWDEVKLLLEMVDALGAMRARAADETKNLVVFLEEEVGGIGAVLPREA